MRLLAVVASAAVAAGCGEAKELDRDTDPMVTVCHGLFAERGAADRAAKLGREAGMETFVRRIVESEAEKIPPRWGVTFWSADTDADARDDRMTYRRILRREGGKSGHGDDGCLERPPFG